MKKILLIGFLIGLTCPMMAQYDIEWTSGNLEEYGGGEAFMDIDDDGHPEFTISSENKIIFYNENYTSKWKLSMPDYDVISIPFVSKVNQNGFVIGVPLNHDADPQPELIVYGCKYTEPDRIPFSKIEIWDTQTQQKVWTMLFDSTDVWVSIADLDKDGRAELIVNRMVWHEDPIPYDYYVDVYSYSGTVGINSYNLRKSFKIQNPIQNQKFIFLIKDKKAARLFNSVGRCVWDGKLKRPIALPVGKYFLVTEKGKLETILVR